MCKNKIRIFSWENILLFRAGQVVYKIHVKRRKSKNFNLSINCVVIDSKKSFLIDFFTSWTRDLRI